MGFRGYGNFGRGYSLIEYILEKKCTLSQASKEFRISTETARVDINRVGEDAFYSDRKDADKLKKMYIAVKKQLSANSASNFQKK